MTGVEHTSRNSRNSRFTVGSNINCDHESDICGTHAVKCEVTNDVIEKNINNPSFIMHSTPSRPHDYSSRNPANYGETDEIRVRRSSSASARRRRKRENERAGLKHLSAWLACQAVEKLYDIAERLGCSKSDALSWAIQIAEKRNYPPPVTRGLERPSILSQLRSNKSSHDSNGPTNQ